jgi:hypothetical protein
MSAEETKSPRASRARAWTAGSPGCPAWFCEGPDDAFDVFFSFKEEDAINVFALKYACDPKEVECRRAEEFDEFHPGPIMPRHYVEAGWVCDCQNPPCSHQVGRHGCVILDEEEGKEDEEEHDGDGPVLDEDLAYCCRKCQKDDTERRDAERKGRDEAKRLVREEALRQWPGIDITRTLTVEVENDGKKTWIGIVHFRFPGGKSNVIWPFGDDRLIFTANDVEAWEKFLSTPR